MSDSNLYLSLLMSGATGLATFCGIIFAYFYLFRPHWRSGNNAQVPQSENQEQSTRSDMKHGSIKGEVSSVSQDSTACKKDTLSTKKEDVDPVTYASHIPSEIKKAQQKVLTKQIEEKMTQEDKEKERQIQREQLQAIFKLMQQQEDKFGIDDMGQMNEQMKYYM